MIITSQLSALQNDSRIQTLDIMRGIVLFGILLMNINGMGLGGGAYNDPTISGGDTKWDLYTWMVTNLLFEGTMRALFSMLFGVGMFVLLDRLEKSGAGINAANIYFRRLTWLLVFGLVHSYFLLWTGEILYNYALMGFLVYSFRKMAPKKLVIISVFLFVAGTLLNYSDYRSSVKLAGQVHLIGEYKSQGRELTKELKEAEQKWEKMKWEKSPAGVAEYNDNMRKGYIDVVAYLIPINQHDDEHYPYRYDVWDVLSMMLLGIALFKWNMLSGKKSYVFYGIIMVAGYGIGLSVNYYELRTILDSNFAHTGFSKANITYDLGRISTAMGHVALIMIFCKLPVLSWLKAALAAVGKMALTNYIMHSVIALFLFTGAGFGLFGKLQRHELLYVVFAIWIFQLILSPIWLKHYQFGPLEWGWRNLSYLKKHRLRK